MDRRALAVVGGCAALFAAFLARGLLLSVGRVVLVALVLALVAGFALLVTRDPAYPRTTVGEGTRVLRTPLSDAFDGDCADCDGPAAGGERRRFVREWVLFGVPLLLLDDGTNVYCRTCAATDSPGPTATEKNTARDRLREE